jgi:hypothetical protein
VYQKEFKFDIEKISDTILEHIEDLLTENKIIVEDYSTLKDKFAKITNLKKKLGLQSLDIVFVWENSQWDEMFNKDKYKKDISEIYNRLNYKFTNCEKIPTFFRGAVDNVPSLHLPCDTNIWFLTKKNFLSSKIKPYILLNFGIDNLLPVVEKRLNENQKNELKYYHIEVNDYYDYDKTVVENWNKK